MSQSPIAVPAGPQSEIFVVEDDHGIRPLGDVFVCDTVCSRGTLVYAKSPGVCSPVSATPPANAVILGFLEQNVVPYGTPGVDLTYGQNATVYIPGTFPGDLVTIWMVGRFYLTNVSGVVADFAPLYPAANGGVSATGGTGVPTIGYALRGNNGVANGPIVAMVNLLSGKF